MNIHIFFDFFRFGVFFFIPKYTFFVASHYFTNFLLKSCPACLADPELVILMITYSHMTGNTIKE